MKPVVKNRNCPPRVSQFRRCLLSAAIMAAGQALCVAPAWAGPEGGRVTGGDGTIDQRDRTTTINQHTDRMVVDWDSFNVDSDETVNYVQPGIDSIALNRILSHKGSEIHGQINANGQVVLINPHGMVFGEDAQVNVGGMIASGLSIDANDFMNGDFTFEALEGTKGTVINRGIIQAATGGSISLLGRKVNNEGLISANLGAVNLAAGKEAVVTFDNAGLMGVRVTKEILQNELGVDPALINSGEINAAGGRVLLTASTSRDIFSQAVNTGDLAQAASVVVHDDGSFTLGGGADVVNTGELNVSSATGAAGQVAVLGENITHSGTVRADSQLKGASGQVELHAQNTTLVTQDGHISARSATGKGGDIALLGHWVGLTDHASLNASGASDGGQILVGGDYKGQNTAIRNSQRTYVGADTLLQANALAEGDGGRIIVWADDITRYAGHLEARGAGARGMGGFAEVSGKTVLNFRGTASLSGPGGGGTLLLDPQDIRIVDNLAAHEDYDENYRFAHEVEGEIRFSNQDIAGLLNNGDDNTNVILEATRDISIEAKIETGGTNTSSLTLRAGDDILVGQNISLGAGDISFSAGVASCSPMDCDAGSEEGVVDLDGGSISINDLIDTRGTVVLRAADNINIGAQVGFNDSPTSVSLRAGNAINASSNITVAGPSSPDSFIRLSAGDASLTTADVALMAPSTGPDFTQDLTVGGVLSSQGADISFNSPGVVTVTTGPETEGGSLLVGSDGARVGSFNNTGGSLDTSSETEGGDISIYSKGDVTLNGASFGGSAQDNSADIGTLTVSSSEGSITLNGKYKYDSNKAESKGTIDLDATLGDVSFVSTSIDNGSSGRSVLDIAIAAGGHVSLDSDDSGLYLTGGEFRVTESGSIDLNQETFNTEGGLVSLQSSGLIEIKKILNTGGGDVDVTSFGDVILTDSVYTSGGTFEAAGVNFTANDREVNTNTDKNGVTSSSSTGGHIALNMTGDVSLGSLVTKTDDGFGDLDITGATITGSAAQIINGTSSYTATSDDSSEHVIQLGAENQLSGTVDITSNGGVTLVNHRATELGTSSISGDFNLTSQGDVGSVGAVGVGGDATFTVLEVDGSRHAIDLSNDGNDFQGNVTIGTASGVRLHSQGSLAVGDITTTGEENKSGGKIELMAGQELTVGALTANAGNRTGNHNGADAGAIVLESGSTITLTNNLSARAHSGERSNRGDGTSESIVLTGDVVLSGPITLNTQMLGDSTGDAGAVEFSGALDSLTSSEHALQIDAGTVTFSGAIGESNGLGALTINARGNVSFGGNSFPNATSITVTGKGDGTLTATNTSNTWNLHQNADGTDADAPNTLNTLIEFRGFDKLVGGSADDHFQVQFSGAEFTLDGGSAAGNQLTAFGDASEWSVLTDGTGSLVDDSATTGFSQIQTLNGTGNDYLQSPNDTNTWELTSAGSGDIRQTVAEGEEAAYSYAFTGMDTLVGGTNSDNFVLNAGASIGSLRGVTEGSEEIGRNTLLVKSEAGDTIAWSVASDGAGSSVMRSDTDTDIDVVTNFYDITSLEGDEGDDIFTVTSFTEGANVAIDGGGASNTLSFEGVTGKVTLSIGGDDEAWSISNVQMVTGNEDPDSLLEIARGTNTWTLDDENKGIIVHSPADGDDALFSGELSFSGFENIAGGDGTDTFIFSENQDQGTVGSLTGTLDGGSVLGNSLEVQGGTNNWTLGDAHSGDVEGRVHDFTSIQTLTGAGDDTLKGRTQSNQWQLDSDGEWTVANADDDSDKLAFSGMSTLVGNSGEDHFTLAEGQSFGGTLDGDSSSGNSLEVQGGTNSWTLDDAHGGDVESRVQSFANMQTLTGAGGDTLTGTNQTSEWRLTGSQNGTLGAPGAAEDERLNFKGFATLQGGSGRDDFYILDDGDLSFTLSGGGGAGINSLYGAERENRWQIGTSNTLNETIIFSSIDTLVGNTKNDIFVVAQGESIGTVRGVQSGGIETGTNTLELQSDSGVDVAWTVSAADQGQVAGRIDNFYAIGNLTGGEGHDAFTLVEGASLSGEVDGGNGINELAADTASNEWSLAGTYTGTLEDVSGRSTNFSQIQTLSGSGNDTLTGREQNNDWLLNSEGDWSVVNADTGGDSLAFSGMSTLMGNSDEDHFTLVADQNFGGTLDGGSASGNTLEVQGGTNSWALDGAHSGGVGGRLQSFANMQILKGAGTDTLIGRNQNNQWRLGSSGEWTVANADDDSDKLAFSGMSTLVGNSGGDHFALVAGQDFLGMLDGGSASGNTLEVQGGINSWTLGAAYSGEVENRVQSFTSIQTLAGAGNDALTGRAQNNDWLLNSEGDWSVVNADTGGDSLAFSGMSTLIGNAGQDQFQLSTSALPSISIEGGSDRGNSLIIDGDVGLTWNLSSPTSGNVNSLVMFNQIQLLDLSDHTGTSELKGLDVDTRWLLDDQSEGRFGALAASEDSYTQFKGFDTLQGGNSRDDFYVLNTDDLSFTLKGGDGTNALYGANRDNKWQMGAINTLNDTITFSGMDTLVGHVQDDAFVLESNASIVTLRGVQDGATETGTNTLEVQSDSGVDVAWTVSAVDQGSVTGRVDNFYAIGNLTGGTGDDVFELMNGAHLSGEIIGGIGTNALIANAGGNNWNMTGTHAGTLEDAEAHSMTFIQIQTLMGSGSDTLTALSDQDNRWEKREGEWRLEERIDSADDTLTFSGMTHWVGGGRDDEFNLGSAEGIQSIVGGEGTNSLSASGDRDWALTGAFSGTLDPALGFSGIQSLTGSDGTHTLTGVNQDNKWRLTSASGGTVSAAGADASDRLAFAGMNILKGLGGDDRFERMTDTAFAGEIQGGGGSNTLKASGANQWTTMGVHEGTLNDMAFSGIQTLEGGGDQNRLNGADEAADWTLVGAQTGTMTVEQKTLTFSGMEHLTGGSASDDFTLATGLTLDQLSSFGQIDGGVGKDSLKLTGLNTDESITIALSDNAGAHLVALNLETLDAHAASGNTLLGPSEGEMAYQWSIDQEDAGTLSPLEGANEENTLVFSRFSNLTGGDNRDVFALTGTGSITGLIDGGGGINLLDQSLSDGPVKVTLGSLISDSGINIVNISGVIGKNDGSGVSADDSTLTIAEGSNSTNTWTIEQQSDVAGSDGINDGYVQNDEGDSLYFVNFNRLIGGDGNDKFEFKNQGQLIGTLDGRGGDNTVDATGSGRDLSFSFSETGDADTYLQNIVNLFANNDQSNKLVGGNGENAWLIHGASGAGSLNETLVFSGFSHLVGGSDQDTFVLTGVGAVDRIDGGATSQGKEDSVDLSQVSDPRKVSLDWEAEADLSLANIDHLIGRTGAGHQLLADNRDNRWVIDDENSGSLNNAERFSGFDYLLGNAKADTFELRGAATVTGSLSGGKGKDTLDLIELNEGRALTLALASRDDADLVLADIEVINAPIRAGHTLLASHRNNIWKIDGVDSGSLNDLSFTGVANLVGGDADDHFEYHQGGQLSGYLSGGDHSQQDVLDLSALSLVDIQLGDDGNVSGIERIIGNNRDTTLRADHIANTWRLNQGENAGTLNSNLTFSGVTHLVGGDAVDTFYLNGGSVTGRLNGGAGDDRFELAMATNVQGRLELRGDAGDDRLLITGGGSGYQTDYSVRERTGETLSYLGPNESVFELVFGGLSRVEDYAVSDHLTLGSTLEADALTLDNQRYQIEGLSELRYENKTHLTVSANADDTLDITGSLNLPGTLAIRNASVTQSNSEALLSARSLQLTGVGAFGSDSQAIHTSVDQLSVDSGSGNLFVTDEGALVLTRFNHNGSGAIQASGGISSEADLVVSGDLGLHSERAGIRLTGENQLAGLLTLNASDAIVIRNNRATTLGDVQAGSLSLTTAGALTGTEALRLEALVLDVDGDVSLTHENNRFDRLGVERSHHLTLTNSEELTVSNLNSSGDVFLQAVGLDISGTLSARSLILNSGSAGMNFNGRVAVEENLTAEGRDMRIEQALDAGLIQLRASGAIEQRDQLRAQSGIDLEAGGNITMSAGSRTESAGGDIRYSSGGQLAVSSLVNDGGVVHLQAGSDINSVLGRDTNIFAHRLEAQAQTGVGREGRLRTEVGELSLTNNSGQVALVNTGALTVERLANNGDIDLTNRSGDLILDGRNGSVFDPDDGDARSAGGTVNGNYQLGKLSISLDNGSLLAMGAPSNRQPDLVARNGTLLVNGNIGAPGRPLVMYFQDSLFIQGVRSWPPVWGFGQRPTSVENNSSIQLNQQDLMRAGGEQMVEVESLEDIDPAIFTEVRNYSFDEVSILMPPDQRYDDDEEEQYSRRYNSN